MGFSFDSDSEGCDSNAVELVKEQNDDTNHSDQANKVYDTNSSDAGSLDLSNDSSDFQIAGNCEMSGLIMMALNPVTASEVEQSDVYKFRDDDEKVGTYCKKSESSEARKKVCCNDCCLIQVFSPQFLSKMEAIKKMSKADKKQFLLDHLGKQEEMGIDTHAFQFFGFFVCKKALVSLSGVSNYIIGESCKAFEGVRQISFTIMKLV